LTSPSLPPLQVLHLELDISGSDIKYSAGDSVAIAPANRPELVDALLARLGLDGSKVFRVEAADGGAGQVGCCCGCGCDCSSCCCG
jgi:sulfite reductase alpha subunit-like flavoprotein